MGYHCLHHPDNWVRCSTVLFWDRVSTKTPDSEFSSSLLLAGTPSTPCLYHERFLAADCSQAAQGNTRHREDGGCTFGKHLGTVTYCDAAVCAVL